MNPGSVLDGAQAARRQSVRSLAPWFFAGWTVLVVVVVWWLVARDSNRADFLIALDRPEADSWITKARWWVETHVEVYWAYPWILLAPYVLWLGLRVTVEKRGLPWRLALYLACGAGFIYASQSMTHRLEAMQPKAVFIKEERVSTTAGTNEPTGFALTRTMEWHGRVPRTGSNGTSADPFTPKVLPIPQRGTNVSPSGVMERNRVFVLRMDVDQTETDTSLLTNQTSDVVLTNETARSLARHLAPLIEAQMRDLHSRHGIAAPLKLTAALDGLAYFALVGLAQSIHFRRRLNERENHATLLESKLVQSRLHALQTQLQPHFLFNALNGISMLVRRDPRIAEEMLASLSELLRVSLAQSGRQEIPLREELDFLDRYLELQEMRFGERLRIERHTDPEALDCLVPSLVFQPLVENAIRHGIEPSPNPGLVRIIAKREGGHVVLAVEDNGCGFRGENQSLAMPGNGIGLNSVRERLSGLYGGRHEFTFREKPSGGVIVRMKIPARMATETGSETAIAR